MDAITLLTQDHREVEQLFRRFETATEERREVAERIIRELAIHSEIEKLHLYPEVRKALGDTGERLAEHSLQEHQQVEEILSKLDNSLGEATSPEFAERMQAVIRDVKEHVEEEERDIFPKLRQALTTERLEEMGTRMQQSKEMVPTHPHPSAPNQGPAHAVLGGAAGIVDRIRDVITGRA
jgi:hemerythrin-like domain-containing protein